jgi:proline iminopeptidase
MDLFPEIPPYSSGFLDVDENHKIYWEQSGNPDGVPIVLLHGGPGAGATPMHRRFFNPEHYRIIIFDQRGAGRSHPLGSIENNSLKHLINDMEELRNRLMIKRWHLFGGSWGSTLALAYAQEHPENCISLILRGIFLLEQQEIDWFLYGMQNIFPEAWEQFSSLIPEEESHDLLNAYYKKLTDDNEETQMDAAINWNLYEGACSSLLPNFETITTDEQKQHALATARIEAHYFLSHVISEENSLLNYIDKIRSIPAVIVQGRYDIICPIKTARKLHQNWPEADYIVVQDGGHSAHDPAIRSRLIEATEMMRTIV